MLVIAKALRRGHTVRALVCDPARRRLPLGRASRCRRSGTGIVRTAGRRQHGGSWLRCGYQLALVPLARAAPLFKPAAYT
ncbi:MAG: hypothetical protein J0M01_09800 [Dechloromonas sp.]|nr:hypothetical protein [Dechloromonas sp.]